MKVKLIPAQDVWQIVPLEGSLAWQAVAEAEAVGVNGCRLQPDGTIDAKYLAATFGMTLEDEACNDPNTLRALGIGRKFCPALHPLNYDPARKVWYDAVTLEIRRWVYRVSVMRGNVYYFLTKEDACNYDWNDVPAFDPAPTPQKETFIQKMRSLVFPE